MPAEWKREEHRERTKPDRTGLIRVSVDWRKDDFELLSMLVRMTGAVTKARLLRHLVHVYQAIEVTRLKYASKGPELAIAYKEPLVGDDGEPVLDAKGEPRVRWIIKPVELPAWPK